MTIEVLPVTADQVRPLRLAVLRPTAPLEPAAYDLEPDTVHIAAFDGERVVGCVSIFPNPYLPRSPGDGVPEPAAWQLRGMAVDPAYQGHGVGRAVLAAAIEQLVARQVPLVWAYGRVSALGFYELMGWHAVGEEFRYGPADLPHFVIRRVL